MGGYALFTTGGGDYCDSSYGLFNAADIATAGAIRRDAEFRTVEIVQAIGGGILFAIGLVILIGLWRARRGLARVRGTVAALAVAAVMAGYAVVALSPAAIPGC